MEPVAVNLALLLLRVVLGSIMLAHGINHVFGGGKIAGTARWFESLGMKPGLFHAWLASVTEVGAGVLIIVGLMTPLAAAAIIATLLVAWVTNHRSAGFFVFHRPTEGWEYIYALVGIGFALALLGPGEWSVDEAVGITERITGLDGLWIALVAGVGGAAATLAAFWRPSKA